VKINFAVISPAKFVEKIPDILAVISPAKFAEKIPDILAVICPEKIAAILAETFELRFRV
jgi:hypothetical protein